VKPTLRPGRNTVYAEGLNRLRAARRLSPQITGLRVCGHPRVPLAASVWEFGLPHGRLTFMLTVEHYCGFSGEGALLTKLAADGRVGFDLYEQAYFHRELPSDAGCAERYNPRLRNAKHLVSTGVVRSFAGHPGVFRVKATTASTSCAPIRPAASAPGGAATRVPAASANTSSPPSWRATMTDVSRPTPPGCHGASTPSARSSPPGSGNRPTPAAGGPNRRGKTQPARRHRTGRPQEQLEVGESRAEDHRCKPIVMAHESG